MKNKAYPYYENPLVRDLKDMISGKAETIPDHELFVYPSDEGDVTKTYKDFYDDVNALGTWMFQKKLWGKNIAIMGENSYEWIVTFYALVMGGNVAVAIDKGLPEEEIQELLKKGEATVVFVSGTYREKVKKKSGRRIYCFDEFDKMLTEGKALLDKGNKDFLRYEIDPELYEYYLQNAGVESHAAMTEYNAKENYGSAAAAGLSGVPTDDDDQNKGPKVNAAGLTYNPMMD